MSAHVLVAGVGNVFCGDDGFGVEVAKRLNAEPWPDGVRVRDVGVRGLHLAYELLEGWELMIVVDAISTGAPPGTVRLVEPALLRANEATPTASAHGMDLDGVLATARSLGASLPSIRIVGCDVADVSERLGLTPPVDAAVDPALRLVRRLVRDHLARPSPHASPPKEDRP